MECVRQPMLVAIWSRRGLQREGNQNVFKQSDQGGGAGVRRGIKGSGKDSSSGTTQRTPDSNYKRMQRRRISRKEEGCKHSIKLSEHTEGKGNKYDTKTASKEKGKSEGKLLSERGTSKKAYGGGESAQEKGGKMIKSKLWRIVSLIKRKSLFLSSGSSSSSFLQGISSQREKDNVAVASDALDSYSTSTKPSSTEFFFFAIKNKFIDIRKNVIK